MKLTSEQLHGVLVLRRRVRLADARPNDGRCGNVAAAVEAEFGWKRESGYLRVLDGSVSWVHCWNRMGDGTVLDATADQFGRLWLGDVAIVSAGDELADHYLPDPHHWTLTPQGPPSQPTALVCRRAGKLHLAHAEDPRHPWTSLARSVLQLVTGWTLDDRPVEIAARALRARMSTVGEISTETLIRPLVTESIQHLGRQVSDPWIATEFMDEL